MPGRSVCSSTLRRRRIDRETAEQMVLETGDPRPFIDYTCTEIREWAEPILRERLSVPELPAWFVAVAVLERQTEDAEAARRVALREAQRVGLCPFARRGLMMLSFPSELLWDLHAKWENMR